MFAIVDIETTGGSAADGAITEVAVVLFDGEHVTDTFTTLVNPGCPIPSYISALTGIDNQMVAQAPDFSDIAPKLSQLLENKIFIAHNVNFDHSFLHHHFKRIDISFHPRKLCTVRYARKLIPGLPSYSLGNICRMLEIPVENRHRAFGDAQATARLFSFLLKKDDGKKVFLEMTRGKSAHSYLPMHVPVDTIEQLPYCPGVYYFKDRSGKVVYVGKAINLNHRVKGHFTHNGAGKRRQEMLRTIHSIDYKVCATELMALVLESVEIKRLWPLFNRSQKRFEPQYGLYCGEDQAGRVRIWLDKKKKTLPPLVTFAHLNEGYSFIRRMAFEAGLNPEWVLVQKGIPEGIPGDFNLRMQSLLNAIRGYLPDFALIEQGADEKGQGMKVAYLIQKGAFKGLICAETLPDDWAQLVEAIEPYPENEFIRNTLFGAVVNGKGSVIYP